MGTLVGAPQSGSDRQLPILPRWRSGQWMIQMVRHAQLYLGSSPLAWVLNVRIGVAKTLLTTTTLPINQIAHRAGFSEAYYFSRQFRAHTGLTPSAWRRLRSAP